MGEIMIDSLVLWFLDSLTRSLGALVLLGLAGAGLLWVIIRQELRVPAERTLVFGIAVVLILIYITVLLAIWHR